MRLTYKKAVGREKLRCEKALRESSKIEISNFELTSENVISENQESTRTLIVHYTVVCDESFLSEPLMTNGPKEQCLMQFGIIIIQAPPLLVN